MSALNARRDSFSELRLYGSDSDASAPPEVDLSDNTNRWGMPPAAARALSSMAPARYPEMYAASLRAAAADYVGVTPDMITTGNGSDGVIDAAIRAFAVNGERIAVQDPSFVMIQAYARMNGLVPVMVPMTASYDLDVAAFSAVNARIVYLCSPNNPTGTPVSRAAVEAIVRQTDGLVILDEAYAEFADVNLLDMARAFPNVLVLRTMSKAFGLAGLRVGYGVGAPAVVNEVEKSRGPYRVSAAGVVAACAALRHDVPWMTEHVKLARANRDRLAGELRARGLEVAPSDANFLFAPVSGALDIARHMRRQGVAVRGFAGLRAVSDALARSGGEALRISVGPWAEIEAALAALDAALKEKGGR